MSRALALAVLSLLVGCGGLDPAPERGAAPEPTLAIALAPVRLNYTPTDVEKPLPPARFSPALDPARIRELVGRRFPKKIDIEEQEATTDRERARLRVAAAQAKGATHVLEVDLEDATVRYEDQSSGGLFAFKIVMTAFFFPFDVPNYFIDSDRYGLNLRGRVRVVDVASGQPVGKEVEVQGRQAGTFGDTSRGWYFLGYLRSPGCLDAESWQEIANALAPGAEEDFAFAIAEAARMSALSR